MVAAAALISAVTILSRIVGFGRTFVLAQAVGTSCLSQAYLTATALPTVIFEVVAGGALASMVVPVLAGAFAGGRLDEAHRTASALLTWVVTVLVPDRHRCRPARPAVDVAAGGTVGRMRPQGCRARGGRHLRGARPGIVLYGIAGLWRDPASPASLSCPGARTAGVESRRGRAYLVFWAPTTAALDDLSELTRSALLILAVGTLLGVVVLAATTAIPGAGIRLRPTLRFPDGVAARVRMLALAGLGGFVAQQLTMLLAVALANRYGEDGALAVYTFTWTVYLLPYAVLAVPIATSAFPRLAGSAEPKIERICADRGNDDPDRGPGVPARRRAAGRHRGAVGSGLHRSGAGSTPPERMAWALAAFARGWSGSGSWRTWGGRCTHAGGARGDRCHRHGVVDGDGGGSGPGNIATAALDGRRARARQRVGMTVAATLLLSRRYVGDRWPRVVPRRAFDRRGRGGRRSSGAVAGFGVAPVRPRRARWSAWARRSSSGSSLSGCSGRWPRCSIEETWRRLLRDPAAARGAVVRVVLVLATSTGGIGQHVRSSAGLTRRGDDVAVAGPEADAGTSSIFVGVGAAFVPLDGRQAGLRRSAGLAPASPRHPCRGPRSRSARRTGGRTGHPAPRAARPHLAQRTPGHRREAAGY